MAKRPPRRASGEPRAASASGSGEPAPPRAKHDEPPLERPGNAFPAADPIDPRAMGAAGVRLVVEDALLGLHGFGDDLWQQLGTNRREIARHRRDILVALRRIVADPERGRVTNRTAAVALLGELGGAAVVPDLAAVLSSPREKATTRGWAAASLGRYGRSRAVAALACHLADPHPLVRRRVIDGLAASGALEAIDLLRTVVNKDPDAVTANRAFDAVRALEKAHRLSPSRIRRRRLPAGGGETSAVESP